MAVYQDVMKNKNHQSPSISLPPHRQLVVMALAAACLHLFAQSNWTGPSLQILHSDLLPAALLSSQVPPLYVVPSMYSLRARPVSAHTLKT